MGYVHTGYQRAEVIGALASASLLFGASLHLLHEASERLESNEHVDGPTVIIIATASLGVNLVNLRLLSPAQDNINVRAAYIHALSDCMGSVGVIISGVFTTISGGVSIVDPIITLLFAAYILWSAFNLAKETLMILMETSPVDAEPIRKAMESLPGVQGVHNLHIWTISTGKIAMTVHLVSTTPENTLAQAHESLRDLIDLQYATVQVENPDLILDTCQLGDSSKRLAP